LASLGIEVALVCGIKLPSAFFLWTAPTWLVWYVLADAGGPSPFRGVGRDR